MPPVTIVVAGAGNRGTEYAEFARMHPERLRIVGVAEPRAERRATFVSRHDLSDDAVFEDWRAMADRPRLADAVIVATQDADHVEPAEAFAQRGYHLLLEKPMAPDESGCRRIVEAVERAGVLFAVCHVLRYTRYTRRMKEAIDSGAIGDVVSVQRLEPVGFWHYAHSYVRGNWRRAADSSSMLLAKSCHDLDWILHVMGGHCRSVSSFGALRHFRRDNMPEGAAERCLDCDVEPDCAYSAKRIYLQRLAQHGDGWPLDVLCEPVTEENVLDALRDGPYGRCVYACDNDVVDHQVVNLLFDGARTASFTMTGFTPMGGRRTTVFGTQGQIVGDGSAFRVHDFLTGKETVVDGRVVADAPLSTHGGGDLSLMDAFVDAVARGDGSGLLSGARESLESHLMVFRAEQARLEHRVVDL
jgi:predicted dehydrogenase